jgi:hypothetical protein
MELEKKIDLERKKKLLKWIVFYNAVYNKYTISLNLYYINFI